MSTIPVKNISPGPQTVEGAGTLVHGEISYTAEDCDHTRAMLDAGLLIEVPAPVREADEADDKPSRTRGKNTGDTAGKED